MSRFFGSAPVAGPENGDSTGSEVPAVPVLVVTGPVGVGKTSVGGAVGELLAQRGIGYALIDLDQLRYAHPPPDNDPFHELLGLANLTSIWPNYRDAGCRCLILPTVIESRSHVAAIERAVPGARVLVVRLHASLTTIRERLQDRESGTALTWHLQRTAELLDVYRRVQPEDVLIDTETRSVREVAGQITERWPGAV